MYAVKLLGAELPSLTQQDYMGTTVYAFNINDRYTGYTWDQQLWHVLDHNDYVYTSYSTADFLSWLDSIGSDYTQQGSPVIDNSNNGSFLNIQTTPLFSWGRVALFGAAVVAGIIILIKT